MSDEIEMALLKHEVHTLAEQVEKQGELVSELNLSIAKFKGMAGIIMMTGTLVMAGLKLAHEYFRGG